MVRNGRSGNRSARYDPLRLLAGNLRDEVVVTVVMHNGDSFSFRHSCDEQVGQADRSAPTGAPQRGLDVERAPPVLVVSGQPLIASVAVGSQLVELWTAAGGPAEFEFDDAAGSYHARFDQRRQGGRNHRVVQAGQRAGVCQVARYRCHAARITSSSSRSGRRWEVNLCRSRRRAASAVTSRRAALTVSFLVAVPSICWAATRYSSSISIRVLAMAVLLPFEYIQRRVQRIYSRGPGMVLIRRYN